MPDHDGGAWADVQRVEGFAGETRMNLARLAAIAVFYVRHLVEVIAAAPSDPVRGAYHTRITWICLLWAGAGAVLYLWLRRRRVEPWLKYVVVVIDAVMITLICTLAGGPKSPLVLLYFPLVASAPLRLSLRLVYVATAAAILGYLCVLGVYAWYVIGFQTYYATPALRIPRSQEAIVILALLATGFLCGQIVRQMRRMILIPPVIIGAEQG
jgi:hypothetical protein